MLAERIPRIILEGRLLQKDVMSEIIYASLGVNIMMITYILPFTILDLDKFLVFQIFGDVQIFP
jgi:hypothetical protein